MNERISFQQWMDSIESLEIKERILAQSREFSLIPDKKIFGKETWLVGLYGVQSFFCLSALSLLMKDSWVALQILGVVYWVIAWAFKYYWIPKRDTPAKRIWCTSLSLIGAAFIYGGFFRDFSSIYTGLASYTLIFGASLWFVRTAFTTGFVTLGGTLLFFLSWERFFKGFPVAWPWSHAVLIVLVFFSSIALLSTPKTRFLRPPVLGFLMAWFVYVFGWSFTEDGLIAQSAAASLWLGVAWHVQLFSKKNLGFVLALLVLILFSAVQIPFGLTESLVFLTMGWILDETALLGIAALGLWTALGEYAFRVPISSLEKGMSCLILGIIFCVMAINLNSSLNSYKKM